MRAEQEKYKAIKPIVRRLARRERFWRAVLKYLEAPRRRRRVVNVYELNRVSSASDKVFIVGKLLGTGLLNHPLTVVAFDFSESAYRKVVEAGGRAIYLRDFLKDGPDVSGFKIIG